ncbi:MAG: hypothetical protein DYG92_00320 [Leptolyngbya sp. PLA1]|nr:hypothetical protein [Leptolyngbya sp. PLA1]
MGRWVLMLLLSAGVALGPGCAKPAGVLFAPGDGASVWPPPPDEPRIRFAGEIRSAADLKPGRSTGEGLASLLFGSEPAPGMVSPMGVCTDGADRVFIADSTAQVLHVLDLRTREHERWKPGEGAPEFLSPVAVAFDEAGGRVLVSDSGVGAVFAFDLRGRYLGLLGRGAVSRPCGVAVQPGTGRVAVADVAAHEVVLLSGDGVRVGGVGGRGREAGQFNFPTYVAFGEDGRLYVADSLNFRVQVFSPGLEPLAQIGGKGDMPGYFAQPKGVAVSKAGQLFVTDANFEAVQVFDGAGVLLMTFGREGRGPGEFWLPAGVAVDAKGRVWIADSRNRRVQVFELIPAGGVP